VLARILPLRREDAVPLRVTATLEDSGGRTLNADAPLASGERYAIRLSASRPAWFHVFNEDGQLKVERYFPSTLGGRQSGPQDNLRIPQDPAHSFELDHRIGLERLTILISPTARTDIGALHAEVKRASQRALDALAAPAS
jgi:hypothetical protein